MSQSGAFLHDGRFYSISKGLAKLLLYEHSLLHPKSPYVMHRFGVPGGEFGMDHPLLPYWLNTGGGGKHLNIPIDRMDEIDALNSQHPSDYSDVHIPWGPQW